MSALHDVLQEELERALRVKSAIELELKDLPLGYISRKNIRNKPAYYLQKRQGQKIISKYLPIHQVPKLEKQIKRRRQLQASLRALDDNVSRLRRALK